MVVRRRTFAAAAAMFNLVGIAVAFLTSPVLMPTNADRTCSFLT